MQLSKLNVPSPKRLLAPMKETSTWPLLLVWLAIGAILRLTQLSAKPPWTDEFATLVFSLGNSYTSVPLDEAISLGTLLQPLQTNLGGELRDVVTHLMNEDNHPPLYFILAHLWMKLLPMGDYVSVWAARSLPALCGILSIPAMYALAWTAFRSAAIAHAVAALMAVSPYGVYLAQEARHYTLAILFVIASLTCLVEAVRHLWRGTTIPMRLVGLWVLVNALGFTTHYFFVLTLAAEAIALGVLLFFWGRGVKFKTYNSKCVPLSSHTFRPQRTHRRHRSPWPNNLWRLGIAAVGTTAFSLVWLGAILPDNYGSTMTDWIRQDNSSILQIINPVFQLGASIVTMLVLLPVESPWLPAVIVSGALMLVFFCWVVPILVWGAKLQGRHPYYYLGLRVALAFVGSAIALFFAITYFKGIDITRGARYSFVYFPGVILLLGASLAACLQHDVLKLNPHSSDSLARLKPPRRLIQGSGALSVALVGLVGLISAITVASNLGYQKYYRPDRLVPILEQSAAESVLIATTHETLVQTGEMMGLAWELKGKAIAPKINVLLAHQPQKNSPVASETLAEVLKTLPRSLDLWLVNFHAPVNLHDCVAHAQSFPRINGYSYQLYRCPEVDDIRAQDEQF
jgi:uncharacterized membrane protein